MSAYGPPSLRVPAANAPRPASLTAGAFASVIDALPREPTTGLAAERLPAQAPPQSCLRRAGLAQARQRLGRLVRLGLVAANERDRLRCTMADVEKLDSAEDTGFMPGTAPPVSPAMPRLCTARRRWTRCGRRPHQTVINSGTQQMGSTR